MKNKKKKSKIENFEGKKKSRFGDIGGEVACQKMWLELCSGFRETCVNGRTSDAHAAAAALLCKHK